MNPMNRNPWSGAHDRLPAAREHRGGEPQTPSPPLWPHELVPEPVPDPVPDFEQETPASHA